MKQVDLPRLGEVIPALLERRGVEVVFGIPGVHTIELYRGLKHSGLRHVTPRHEQGAGFMADGYARATGKVAACFIVTGPGLLNIATAMGQALADSIPMLVITSTNQRETLGLRQGRLHEIKGQTAIGRELSVLNFTILSAQQLVPALDQAFAHFASARPGPVHIEIPIDVLQDPFEMPTTMASLPSPPAANQVALQQAADLINAAKNPVVILGGGCVRGAADIRRMAERIGAPALMTTNARGILPASHPLNAGGGLPFSPARNLIRNADVVLAIGTELGETDFEFSGEEGPVELPEKLIRVDIDAAQLLVNAPALVAIAADAGQFALGLQALLTAKRDGSAVARKTRNSAMAEIDPRFSKHLPLVESIWAYLPEAIVVGDSTAPSYVASLLGQPPAARRLMSAATGFGTLGYALPAAIGAKVGRPDAPVVCIVGDGGFQFSVPELAASAESGVPVIVLLWNDQCYGEISHYMETSDVPLVGVDLYATDFGLVAKAFGASHVFADTSEKIGAEMVRAAQKHETTIIEIDADQFVVSSGNPTFSS